MKYAQIATLRQHYPVSGLCRALGVSESGYHGWRQRPPSRRSQEDVRLTVAIKAAHTRTRETYGPERLQAELADQGIKVGIHKIKRIRREQGLRCRQKRKFKATTDSCHKLPGLSTALMSPRASPLPAETRGCGIKFILSPLGSLH